MTKRIIKAITPSFLHSTLKKIYFVEDNRRAVDLGNYIVEQAKKFSETINGKKESFDPFVCQYVFRKKDSKSFNKTYGSLLEMFMPDYEKNLYSYYLNQQYLILLTFLGYPFRGDGSLRPHVLPFDNAAKTLDKLKIINYGAGIPFGIIDLLRKNPQAIENITLIDLKLIHVELVEFIIKQIAPNINLTIFKLEDTEVFPNLGRQKYNLLYGKDIFEHLVNPEEKLKKLLDSADKKCLCYFDFRDHGERYGQHVTPNISYLSDIVEKYGFVRNGTLEGLSEFVR